MKRNSDLHKTIAVGLVWNTQGELLFCKMNPGRGVFPGQWAFPGGGIEPGEKMDEALRGELNEEIGIDIVNIRSAFFKDCTHEKFLADGTTRSLYMIFLFFHCTACNEELELNDEFAEYIWAKENELDQLDLNKETIDTLKHLGKWQYSKQ